MKLSTAYRGLAAFATEKTLPETVRKPILLALENLESSMRLPRNDFAEEEPTTEPYMRAMQVDMENVEGLKT